MDFIIIKYIIKFDIIHCYYYHDIINIYNEKIIKMKIIIRHNDIADIIIN